MPRPRQALICKSSSRTGSPAQECNCIERLQYLGLKAPNRMPCRFVDLHHLENNCRDQRQETNEHKQN